MPTWCIAVSRTFRAASGVPPSIVTGAADTIVSPRWRPAR
jgi:hypothetical protein